MQEPTMPKVKHVALLKFKEGTSQEQIDEVFNQLLDVSESVPGIDDYVAGPNNSPEDLSNGFTHGGWAMPFVDDVAGKVIGEIIGGEFDMLLGRRTYDIFASYWPNHGDNPIGKAFNEATKYVVTHRPGQLGWKTSQPIGGDVVAELRRYMFGAAANCCRR